MSEPARCPHIGYGGMHSDAYYDGGKCKWCGARGVCAECAQKDATIAALQGALSDLLQWMPNNDECTIYRMGRAMKRTKVHAEDVLRARALLAPAPRPGLNTKCGVHDNEHPDALCPRWRDA